MRALDSVRERGDDSAAILSLDGLKMEMKENDKRLLARLDELVRKNRISAQMATSLINDSNYAYGVTKNLVKMGEILFSAGHTGIRSAERSLSLDVDEVEQLLTETQTNIEERR